MTQNKHFTQIREIHKSLESVIPTGYDIVKAQGGELKVETKEKEGATIIIFLPA